LNEWDVTKLGWLKSRSPTENHIDSAGQQIIRQSFKVEVEDCSANNFKYQFFRGFLDQNQLEGGRRIQEMFPFIKKTSIWQRHVEITHRESPLLVMTMQHRSRVDVVMRYHESALEDFSGFLQVDSYSNALLNLTLMDVTGTIHGTISSNNFTQVLQVSVGNQLLSRHEKQLKVVGLLSCNNRGQVTVSLKPYGGRSKSTITRSLPCTVDSLRHFRHVLGKEMTSSSSSNSLANQAASLSRHCLGCSDTWLYYIDPFNWADSIWTTTRIIIAIVLTLCAVTFFTILFKACICMKQCCC